MKEPKDVVRIASHGASSETATRSSTGTLARPNYEVQLLIRRLVDLVGSLIALLCLAPVFAFASLLVWLDSPGPVFVSFPRLGLGRAEFRCYKFRTMYVDGERRLSEYLKSNTAADQEWALYHKLREYDPRVTRIGVVLRRTSLDEIPQFLNVLLGHMSLVGPRPYLPRELSLMGEAANTILSVKPGCTGLWQVSGRNQLTFRERVALEAEYVATRTLLQDLWLLLKTPLAIVARRGAY